MSSYLHASAAPSVPDLPHQRTHESRCLETARPYWHDKETLEWIVAGNEPVPVRTMPMSIRSPALSETGCAESEHVCADEPVIAHPSGVSDRLVAPPASPSP